jgi:hypothetical protein
MVITPKSGAPSIADAISTLEKAVRREIADIEEIRIAFEPDDRKRIAFMFSVVRRPPIA